MWAPFPAFRVISIGNRFLRRRSDPSSSQQRRHNVEHLREAANFAPPRTFLGSVSVRFVHRGRQHLTSRSYALEMLKSAVTLAIAIVAFAQFASTYWNWEQTAGFKGTFVCNISTQQDDNFTQHIYVAMVDRYAPVTDPDIRAKPILSNGSFIVYRVVKKMTPFLPAVDVYHKCFDNTARNCSCFLKFRLGADPAKGDIAKCVSLGRKPQTLGWHQEWCLFEHVDLQAYNANATCDHELCGGQ